MASNKDEGSGIVGELMRRQRVREVKPHEACGRPIRVAQSRVEVAALMGTTVAMVAQVEGGHCLPSQDFLRRYAKAVGVDDDVWCGWMRARGGAVSEAFVAGFDAGRLDVTHLLPRDLSDEVAAVSEATRADGSVGEDVRATLTRLVRLGLEATVKGGF